MAWRYRDRDSKQFVSELTYNRSRSHGGTRFERVSDSHWSVRGSRLERKESELPEKTGDSTATALSQNPKNARDYQRLYDQSILEELENFEVETGVDY